MSDETQPLVLVIDDEVGPRESLRILLKNEYRVLCAESVDKGLKYLDDVGAETIVLDIRMPGKSGIEGLGEIRKRDAHVPVIMLTGYGTLETAQKALRLGATDYLKKPFDTDEMLAKIRECVKRRRVETLREETAGRLESLNERLLEELAHMEELASMGQSSAEFVHDLRNPLTIVLGYVELLNQQLEGVRDLLGGHYEDTLRYLEVINSNAERCKQLADAWQGAGEHAGEMEPVRIADLLRSVREGIEFLAAGRHAAIDFDVGINGAEVKANRSQLLRAVHNVVSNAIQAVPDSGGHIYVTGRQSEDWVEIEVADNGCGIPEEIRTRIFEPYFTTKAEGEGTGLGLAITKRIVEDFDGTLSVESEPGRGTSVRLRLPAMRQ